MENNKYIQRQNKAKKEAKIITLISMLALSFAIFLVNVVEQKTSAAFLCNLILFFSIVFCFVGICLLVDSFNNYLYLPKYQVGDKVIISKTKENGNKEYPFSKYDDIINQIPQYTVKEIGDCSYLLVPLNHPGEVKEINFKDYKIIFSIAEFKERAKCC